MSATDAYYVMLTQKEEDYKDEARVMLNLAINCLKAYKTEEEKKGCDALLHRVECDILTRIITEDIDEVLSLLKTLKIGLNKVLESVDEDRIRHEGTNEKLNEGDKLYVYTFLKNMNENYKRYTEMFNAFIFKRLRMKETKQLPQSVAHALFCVIEKETERYINKYIKDVENQDLN